MSGFDSFSLALFTTLAPAGVVAFIVLALVRLTCRNHDEAVRVDRIIALPFAVTLIGFIASATHLGTPANALHVFSGVGTSPLSNEVLAAVIFLFLVGAYWMSAFKVNFPDCLARPWLTVACAAGLALIACTSLAYSARTVPTWDTPYTPANLILAACLAGPVLALPFLALARVRRRSIERALVVGAAAALVLGTASLAMQNVDLATIANNEVSALSLAPHYGLIIVAYAVLGALAVAAAGASLGRALAPRGVLALRIIATILALSGVFLVRTVFYALHMTVGL